MFPKWSFDLCKLMVSSIHAVFAVILCSISVQDWRCPVCPLASNSSPLQVRHRSIKFSNLVNLLPFVQILNLWYCFFFIFAFDIYRQMRVLELSLAYFIYDLVCCWFDNNKGIDNLAHHLVSIVGIGAGTFDFF
ncbi:putative TLC domain-containing protein [Helianthus anomalus]